jgi:hypothetical protein
MAQGTWNDKCVGLMTTCALQEHHRINELHQFKRGKVPLTGRVQKKRNNGVVPVLDGLHGGGRIDGLHLLLEVATDRDAGASHVPDGMGELETHNAMRISRATCS